MLKIVAVDNKQQILVVTVQGDSPVEANSSEAKKLAYEERLKHGFERAGIMPHGGPYPMQPGALAKEGEAVISPLSSKERTAASKALTDALGPDGKPGAMVYHQEFKITRTLS